VSNIFATSQTAIGLAKEVTRGTAVAPAYWAKVKSPAYKPNLTILEDDTLQGSMVNVYDVTSGFRYDGHGWTTFPYMDVLPLYVLAELGSPDTVSTAPTNTTLSASAAAGATTISTVGTIAANSWITLGTGASLETHYTTNVSGGGPYTVTLQYPLLYAQSSGVAVTGLTGHDFSLLNNGASGTGNQPPSLTITDYDGDQWRQITSAQLDKFDLKIVPNKTVDLDVTFLGDPSITPSSPSTSFSTEQMAAPWTTAIAIGGTQVKYVEDITLSLSRGVKPIEAFQGTQGYYRYFAGALMATVKLTVVEQAAAPELTAFLAGTQQSFDISLFDRKSGHGARFHATNSVWKTGELVRGKEWVEATLEADLLPTSTDATAGGVSPINVSIGNAVTATY